MEMLKLLRQVLSRVYLEGRKMKEWLSSYEQPHCALYFGALICTVLVGRLSEPGRLQDSRYLTLSRDNAWTGLSTNLQG